MCAPACVCVCLSYSALSLHYRCRIFFTHPAFCCAVVMHMSARVCLCVQRYLHNCKHSTPLFDYIRRSLLTSALNHANFLQIQHYSTIADKTGSLPSSFCERTRSYQSISNFQVDNLRTTICNNVTSLALFVACPDF